MSPWKSAEQLLPRAIRIAIAAGKPRFIITLDGLPFIVSQVQPHDKILYPIRPKRLTARSAA